MLADAARAQLNIDGHAEPPVAAPGFPGILAAVGAERAAPAPAPAAAPGTGAVERTGRARLPSSPLNVLPSSASAASSRAASGSPKPESLDSAGLRGRGSASPASRGPLHARHGVTPRAIEALRRSTSIKAAYAESAPTSPPSMGISFDTAVAAASAHSAGSTPHAVVAGGRPPPPRLPSVELLPPPAESPSPGPAQPSPGSQGLGLGVAASLQAPSPLPPGPNGFGENSSRCSSSVAVEERERAFGTFEVDFGGRPESAQPSPLAGAAAAAAEAAEPAGAPPSPSPSPSAPLAGGASPRAPLAVDVDSSNVSVVAPNAENAKDAVALPKVPFLLYY
eukprot:tig00000042_g15572.t1